MSATENKSVLFIIRDGWGVNEDSARSPELAAGDATLLAKTPVHDELLANRPHTLIGAAGECVGLPDGQMGNSEVGHLNLGAGRVVYQDFTRITKSIKDGDFFDNPAFVALLDGLKSSTGRLHLIGLCSDGGVHSHLEHLYALLELAKRRGVAEVFVHCLMDGRDTSPTSGITYIKALQDKMAELGVGKIASIIGRYYAMDRDNRWDRVALAHAALVNGKGTLEADAIAAMRAWYAADKTDEFIPPTIVADDEAAGAASRFKDGDGVIFFNFRADRAREITRALTEDDFAEFERAKAPQLSYVCLTEYNETFGLPVAYPPQRLANTLAEILAGNGLKQLRIAETEKYAHVTFFLNGGDETPVAGEDRCLIPSPKVATYDLQPEMNAYAVTEEVLRRLELGKYALIVLNYANPDMVGHTGIIEAAIEAIEVVDECLGKLLPVAEKQNYVTLISADHGNAEQLIDADGGMMTAHTTNRVHFIYAAPDSAEVKLRDNGILADVAPTILKILNLPAPPEMTGKSLLV